MRNSVKIGTITVSLVVGAGSAVGGVVVTPVDWSPAESADTIATSSALTDLVVSPAFELGMPTQGADTEPAPVTLVTRPEADNSARQAWNFSGGAGSASSQDLGLSDMTVGSGSNSRSASGTTGNSADSPPMSTVPLPAAAWAGLATMAGLLGCGVVRRKSQLS